MEPLFKQVRELPTRLQALPRGMRLLLLAGVAMLILVAAFVAVGGNAMDGYQYAFTNLSAEDSTEAAQTLKNSNIPFRLEAGGSALAVPASKVYDARLLLASAGLPRGGGVGFELFDRGDLGVSEFTQHINLRRALEGELSRTLSKLSEVRSARVHLSMAEHSLYREEDRKASAAVVLNLQPGRAMGEGSLAGVRHLVASAVPGLTPENVTVVDGHGAVLTSDDGEGGGSGYQRKLEHELEARVVSLLESAVGAGAVVAKVNAALDTAQVSSTAETFDADNPVLRSERKTLATQSQDANTTAGVAGAAANQPINPAPAAETRPSNRSASNSQDEVKNYEISKTTTTSVSKQPRLQRLSVAVLLSNPEGKPRTDAEVAHLGELAKRAVGFDEARGDQLEITAATFGSAIDAPATPAAHSGWWPLPGWALPAIGGGALLAVLLVAFFALSRGSRNSAGTDVMSLQPGMKVGELEARNAAAVSGSAAVGPGGVIRLAALPDPALALQDRARQLVSQEPSRAAHLIRAWLNEDSQPANPEVKHG